MAQQTINTTDSPETGRGKINANFTEVYNITNLLPSQTGNANKFLKTNGAVASWAAISSVPASQMCSFLFSNVVNGDSGTLAQLGGNYYGFNNYSTIIIKGVLNGDILVSETVSLSVNENDLIQLSYYEESSDINIVLYKNGSVAGSLYFGDNLGTGSLSGGLNILMY